MVVNPEFNPQNHDLQYLKTEKWWFSLQGTQKVNKALGYHRDIFRISIFWNLDFLKKGYFSKKNNRFYAFTSVLKPCLILNIYEFFQRLKLKHFLNCTYMNFLYTVLMCKGI